MGQTVHSNLEPQGMAFASSGLKKEIVTSAATFVDQRPVAVSSIGQSLHGDHPDESNLRDEMCLSDPEALRLESIRGLSVQIRHINQTLLREPIGSVDQGELAGCLKNLG